MEAATTSASAAVPMPGIRLQRKRGWETTFGFPYRAHVRPCAFLLLTDSVVQISVSGVLFFSLPIVGKDESCEASLAVQHFVVARGSTKGLMRALADTLRGRRQVKRARL